MQAQEKLHHLKEAEDQLALAQVKIGELTKELGQKAEEIAKVKQAAYNLGQKEIEAHLKSQITTVCLGFLP